MLDQTNREWLLALGRRRVHGERELGTGIFLIPEVESRDTAATRKILVPDLTYEECQRRGISTVAFKWVPSFIASYGQLSDTLCGAECEDTCSQQQPGCLCNDRRHRCE